MGGRSQHIFARMMPCIELMGHKCWYAKIRVALCRLVHKSRSLFFANLETKSDSSRTHWYPISPPPDCAKIETIFGERPIPTFSLLRIFVWSPVFPWREPVSIPQQGNPGECRDGSQLADIRAFIQRWKRYFFSFSSIWTEAYSMLRPIIHRNIFLRNVCSQSFQNIFLCKYFCVRSVFVPNKFISALTHWLDQRVINTVSGWAKEDIIRKTIELDKYEIIMRIV